MIEVRIHGRGGQGAVTAAYILASAAFEEGKYAQAFPMFGVERRGAPVQAFVRIDDKPIRVRTQIYNPDYVIVLDPSLVKDVDVAAGAKKMIIINSSRKPDEFKLKVTVKTVDISKIAIEVLGRDITNTGALAAFSAFTNIVKIGSVETALKHELKPELVEKNLQMVRRVHELGRKG